MAWAGPGTIGPVGDLTGPGDTDEALVMAWLRDHLDGEVVAITRQARWRPR